MKDTYWKSLAIFTGIVILFAVLLSGCNLMDVEPPITWQGSHASHPENPEPYWAYYNISDGNTYIYNGLTWEIFAQSGEPESDTVIIVEYYTVFYDGNGNDSGMVPTFGTNALVDSEVTVLGNTGNLKKTGFSFEGWNTKTDGSGYVFLPDDIITMPAGNMVLYALWQELGIGDIGQAGGIVFYDKGSYSDGWRYMEVAPASEESAGISWGSNSVLVGGTETAVGTGLANTEAIVAALGDSGNAAGFCSTLTYEGYSDWFLPSKDELWEIWWNLVSDQSEANEGKGEPRADALGDFSNEAYWSSSEASMTNAWYLHFNNAHQPSVSKSFTFPRVRPVRRF